MKAACQITALLATTLIPASTTASPDQPNIILILTDDLGWGDIGIFHQNARHNTGKPSLTTPYLDTLASQGAMLTHHYCAAPVCAPSRASLLTGVNQGNATVRDNQFDKALEENHTLASVLHRAGYATAAIGKWGLHGQPQSENDGARPDTPANPLNRGFDFFFGYLRHVDGHEHYPKESPYFIQAKRTKNGPVKVWENRTDVTIGLDKCYSADLFTARAKKFIIDSAAVDPRQPFFLYLAYDTPHAAIELPTQAYPTGGGLKGGVQWLGKPGQMINTASGVIDSWVHPEFVTATFDEDGDPATPPKPWREIDRRYATSVRRIDDCVGDLVQLLKDLHIDDNTLIVFTSDNGVSKESYLPEERTPEFFASFGPFDGIKRDLWEGGLRVPTIANWPGRIPPGRIVAQPSAQWDWLSTFADVAGLPAPARTDGLSLVPALTDREPGLQHDHLYFEYFFNGSTPNYPAFEPEKRNRPCNQMQAVRIGDFMGVRYNIKTAHDDFEIYNVVTDPKETVNLAKEKDRDRSQIVETNRRWTVDMMQTHMKEIALQSRRPDQSAPRPYDVEFVPAVDAGPTEVGIAWQHFEGSFPWVPDFKIYSNFDSGITLRPDPEVRGHASSFGLRFTGYLLVPVDGDYTFYLATDTGGFLRVHDAHLIDADFEYISGTEKMATIRLQAGLHPLCLSYIHAGPAPCVLRFEWSGPGFAKQPVAGEALRYARVQQDPVTKP